MKVGGVIQYEPEVLYFKYSLSFKIYVSHPVIYSVLGSGG